MALIHDVIDSDVRFLIDPAKRTISNQNSTKLILIQGDHNSERFSFEIPRTVEGHDMSLCNVIRIHYINTCSKTRSTSCDIYEPDDMTVSTENTQVVHFSWLISNTATVYAGSLAFAIEFQCVVDDKIVYSWHTAPNTTITISDGISNTEVIAEEYSDILTTWWLRIFANATLPIEIHDMESFAALNGQTSDNTLYLLEDDPTLEEIEKVIEAMKEFEKTLTEHLEQYEALDKSMTEHLTDYYNLDADITKHLEDFDSLLEKVDDLEKQLPEKIDDLEKRLNEKVYDLEKRLNEKMDALEKRLYTLENSSGSGSDSGEGEGEGEGGDTDCEHVWVTTVIEPTCSEEGYTLHECSKCGDSYNDSYTVTIDHDYAETIVTERTCTEPAVQKYECVECGDKKPFEESDIVQEALGHTWEYIQLGPDLWERYCPVCGERESNVEYPCTDGSNHEWEELDITEATCTSPSIERYTCTKCGNTKDGEVIQAALGHDFDDDGICTRCGTCDQHNMEFLTSENESCTEDGYVRYKCTRCDYYEDIVIKSEGHDWGAPSYDAQGPNGEPVYKPTCTEVGYGIYQCSVCGTEKVEAVPATGHEWNGPDYDAQGPNGEPVYKPTCTEVGYGIYTCSVCGAEKVEAVILNHEFDDGVVTPPTCEERGYTTKTCTRDGCGYSYVVAGSYVDALGHDLEVEADDSASSGYVARCTRCDYVDNDYYPDN